MNEVTRRATKEILSRAEEAIGRGEAKGPKLDQCWKRLEKLNGGIVGPKSWEQIEEGLRSPLSMEKGQKLTRTGRLTRHLPTGTDLNGTGNKQPLCLPLARNFPETSPKKKKGMAEAIPFPEVGLNYWPEAAV